MLSWNLSLCNLCYLLSCPFGSFWKESLHPVCSCPLSTGISCGGAPMSLVFPGRKDLAPSAFLYITGFPAFWLSFWPFFGPQSVCVLPELWGPELDTVLQVQPEKHWAEWEEDISISASNVPVDAALNPTYLCCCNGSLLTCVQLIVH